MQAARGASLSDDGTEGQPPAPGVPSGTRRLPLLLGVAALVLAVDLVTKLIAVEKLSRREPVELLGGLLTLRLVRNAGAAFGMAEGLTIVLTLVALTVAVIIVRVARRMTSRAWAVALGLVLGGAVGNLVDRFFREPAPLRGHVVDFLELPSWPVFNVADSSIVTGGVLMVLLSILGRPYTDPPPQPVRPR